MIIKSVEAFIVDLPTIRPHQLSMHTIVKQSVVVVKIVDENGTVGWAEVATIGGAAYGESTPEAIKVNLEKYLVPFVLGRNALDFGKIMNDIATNIKGNTHAKSLIESALIDLVSRNKQIPAYELLGGKIHDSLPVAWTLASGDTGRDIEEAKEMLRMKRHNIFKLKIGVGDPRKNVEHVIAIKKALGDDVRITVDVNQAWDENTANYSIAALEDGGVAMVEQPLPTWNKEGMKRLTERFKIAIMADEAATTVQEVFQIAKHQYGNCIALKPCKAGGLFETKKVAAVAEGAGLGLYGGTMIESGLGTSIGVHLYSTISELKFDTEIFGPFLFKEQITVDQLEYKDFEVIVPDKPGFGLEVDEEKVKYFARE